MQVSNFLRESDLDFAIMHIAAVYDTDFFPKTEEFKALEFKWPEVKAYILGKTFADFQGEAPDIAAWPKIKGGFRMVHRLEPLAAIVYTALAKRVTNKIEIARANPYIACSYRLRNLPTSFFAGGSGYEIFRDRCEVLSRASAHVLCVDIVDFYNKIYLHRLGNAIQTYADEPVKISKVVESFLTELNSKASQGVPVGPAASIVFAEAILIDVDDFIANKGFEHARYVDDIRIFGEERQLMTFLQEFSLYIHANHRLTFNADKTFIVTSEEFLQQEVNNHYQEERLQIFGDLDSLNPYALHERDDDEDEDDDDEDDDDEDDDDDDEDEDDDEDDDDDDDDDEAAEDEEAAVKLEDAITRLVAYPTLDLGLIRAVVRSARSRQVSNITPLLLNNLLFFSPAINDICLYFDSVADVEYQEKYIANFELACADKSMNISVVSMWFRWFLSRHKILLGSKVIRKFVLQSSHMRQQAQASITLGTQDWVREHKANYLRLSAPDRRSLALASSVLSEDERGVWLRSLSKNAAITQLEKWLIEWVLAGKPNARAPIAQIVDMSGLDDLFPL